MRVASTCRFLDWFLRNQTLKLCHLTLECFNFKYFILSFIYSLYLNYLRVSVVFSKCLIRRKKSDDFRVNVKNPMNEEKTVIHAKNASEYSGNVLASSKRKAVAEIKLTPKINKTVIFRRLNRLLSSDTLQ